MLFRSIDPLDFLITAIIVLIALSIGWNMRAIIAADDEEYARFRFDRLAIANARLIMLLSEQTGRSEDGPIFKS